MTHQQVIDISSQRLPEIVTAAQELWAQVYGSVRASGLANRSRRSDFGQKQVVLDSASAKPSIAGWIKDRKRTVANLAGPSVPEYGQPDGAVWTEGHAKESNFLKDGNGHVDLDPYMIHL